MRGIIKKYRHRLPLPDGCPELSLGEGGTPLLLLTNLPRYLNLKLQLWVKFEGLNPTGSFKDRGMVVAVADAVAKNAKRVICASTGNTSAAAAAYAGRAGLPCIVLIPAGKVARGKIAQAIVHGAHILQVNGNFDDAMSAVREFTGDGEAVVVNSINPMRLQGQKTTAFEVVEELGRMPDFHALPVGNAGNISAHWLGYREDAEKTSGKPPAMLGYQAEGAAPFINGIPIKKPDTVATAIRIGNPQSYQLAKIALTESGGHIAALSDDDILMTQKMLAELEGIFCEPASAASVAGVIKDAQSGEIPDDALVVCTLTGHGLKDPDIIGMPDVTTVSADITALRLAIEKAIPAHGQ
ncbi:MAG: threonine synthase [Candidatus Zeuxoniibacter abyssi]|nr:MAG: threonine synthase [Candidatus Persebacteraceae bacterium AB1(2)]